MTLKKEKSFFEIYAHEYDFLTNAHQRRASHKKEIEALINAYQPESVLDAGCATGLTSSIFSEAGVKVKGIDRSFPMIKLAKQNYGSQKHISFQSASFEKLPKAFHQKFDMIVCLANSISGVGSLHNLTKSFKGFYNSLQPNGTLVLQLLNYVSIVDGELLPIRATRNNNIIYQRFSERRGKRLYIYVNRLDTASDPIQYEMFKHEFENFTPSEVVETLKNCKFKKIKKFSDLFLSKPFGKTSRDLVLTATKLSK